MTAPRTQPASVADAIRAACDATLYAHDPVAEHRLADLRAALPRAEALEALVEAAETVEAHAPFDPNIRGGIPEGFWRDVNKLNDALRRVREASHA